MASMTAWGALLAGLGAGFLVAAQVGPIWLLCARSVLRHGWHVGAAIGAGAALIDVTYASLGVAGTARLLDLAGLRVILGLVGADDPHGARGAHPLGRPAGA